MSSFGLQNATNVTYDQISQITNISSPEQFFVTVSQIIYNGWLYFVLMCILVLILFALAQQANDAVLSNFFFAFLGVSVLSLFLRAITANIYGIQYALISDNQLWFFPIMVALLGSIMWMTRKEEG
jgi:lipoprotein signal peptidase